MSREPTTYAFNGQRYWTARKVGNRFVPTALRCSACGYHAPHYAARFDPDVPTVFAIPYANYNGGIASETDATYWTDAHSPEVEHILLSKCCDAPSRGSLRMLTRDTPRAGGIAR